MPFKGSVDKGICAKDPNMFDAVNTSVFLRLQRQQVVGITRGASPDKPKFEFQM